MEWDKIGSYLIRSIFVLYLFYDPPRLVPAHGPLLIQRSVMEELQREFRWQWETTSTHRFRMADDMQYSFAYTHYLLEVGQILSFGNILH